METAIRLFAEKGYSNTSTAEIAKAAEVGSEHLQKLRNERQIVIITSRSQFEGNFPIQNR
ncbi:helix-turn-helix domain-containing protein [Paenibacillus chitinolyticus]|uniref:helix-turn-helix domain-containing protein n=1 Tax=Paenibacillus chitinolyticus TaxID=79263 RepID=UPI0038674C1F